MVEQREAREAVLRKLSFCKHLSPAVISALAHIAVPTERVAGTTLQLEGDPAEAMYLVTTGTVKISRFGTNGREQVFNIIGPGGHFNTVPIFDGGLCPAHVAALSDVQLYVLPRLELLALVDTYPELARSLLREFSSRLRHLVDLVDTLALHTVQGRLAGLLLEQDQATTRGEASEMLNQTDIAARLGTVREMVSRTLHSFATLGLIRIDHGHIHVINREGLEELSR